MPLILILALVFWPTSRVSDRDHEPSTKYNTDVRFAIPLTTELSEKHLGDMETEAGLLGSSWEASGGMFFPKLSFWNTSPYVAGSFLYIWGNQLIETNDERGLPDAFETKETLTVFFTEASLAHSVESPWGKWTTAVALLKPLAGEALISQTHTQMPEEHPFGLNEKGKGDLKRGQGYSVRTGISGFYIFYRELDLEYDIDVYNPQYETASARFDVVQTGVGFRAEF